MPFISIGEILEDENWDDIAIPYSELEDDPNFDAQGLRHRHFNDPQQVVEYVGEFHGYYFSYIVKIDEDDYIAYVDPNS